MIQCTGFQETVHTLRNQIRSAAQSRDSVSEILNSNRGCAFIKSSDGTIVHSNREYDRRFVHNNDPKGRKAASFLDRSVADISFHSDRMILGSCSTIEFQHVGLIWSESSATQVLADLHTVKTSLADCGDSTMSILGITRVIREAVSKQQRRLRALNYYSTQLQSMSSSMRQCIILLARNDSVSQIAEETRMARRTIEKYKREALQATRTAESL
ncbi:MAG: hypothetical protein AAFV88_17665 [Planctomycetota bacterium]